jgi:hypothetical protein
MPSGIYQRKHKQTKEEIRIKKNAYMRLWKKINREKVNATNQNWKNENRELVRKGARGYYMQSTRMYWDRWLLNGTKHRAKKKGLPFNLTIEDFKIPDICPVLNIPIIPHSGSFYDNSPSMDRLIPSLGYIKGNVRMISYRANAIKRDATLEELKAIIAYMERELAR